jgi:hypothetical protein
MVLLILPPPVHRDNQKFTASTQWYDDSKGWKSQMGGFSAVASVTTDANNMGGFFVRKLVGGTGVGLQLHKLLPLVLLTTTSSSTTPNEKNAPPLSFGRHYGWILLSGLLSNLCLTGFLASYLADLRDADAWHIPAAMILCAVLESLVFLYYYVTMCNQKAVPSQRRVGKAAAVTAFPKGKTPNSLVSNIVARTVTICSAAMLLYGIRDWLFTGRTIPFIPYDDLYLEWTNAYSHSAPVGSPEYKEQGIGAASFYIGDLYVCQLAGLQLTLLCLYKLLSSYTIRLGNDGGRTGLATARLVWQPAAISNLLLLFQLRVFTSAAASASCHFRYHLMVLAYETFIVGLYAFF